MPRTTNHPPDRTIYSPEVEDTLYNMRCHRVGVQVYGQRGAADYWPLPDGVSQEALIALPTTSPREYGGVTSADLLPLLPDGVPVSNTVRTCVECGIERVLSTGFQRRGGGFDRTCKACRRAARERRAEFRKHGRRFGVEIEFRAEQAVDSEWGTDIIPSYDIASAIREAGVSVEDDGYSHEVLTDSWKIVPDGSVACGWELVSPPLRWQDRDQIRVVCETLVALGCDPDEQCGVHVHHDCSDLTMDAVKRLVKSWHGSQHHIEKITDPDRANGEWCRRLRASDVEDICNMQTLSDLRAASLDRYKALNLDSYHKYGTIELRQHEATLDPDKITSWIAFGQAMISAATTKEVIADDPESLIRSLPIRCATAMTTLIDRVTPRQRSFSSSWA